MQLETFAYDSDQGWSTDTFPAFDSDQALIIVFGSPDIDAIEIPMAELAETYGHSHIIGCSTAGEIFETNLSDKSLSVAALNFEHTPLKTCCVSLKNAEESFAAGEQLAKTLDDPELRSVFLLSEGLAVNGSELVRGLNAILPEHVIVTGGLAGDGDRFGQTWVLKNGKPLSNLVSAVGFYGDAIQIGHGSMGGWDMFGVERLVTGSDKNVLYQLDDKPALQLYKEYLGERASGLPATGLLFPLSLRANNDNEKNVVRTILAIDEEQQSITFAGDIPEGSLVKLMHANFDRLIEGAHGAASMVNIQTEQESPTLAIAISCVGRRLVLGERSEEEIEATLEVLPGNTQQIGFYSYGEISPYSDGHCDLHNQTMTLTVFREN